MAGEHLARGQPPPLPNRKLFSDSAQIFFLWRPAGVQKVCRGERGLQSSEGQTRSDVGSSALTVELALSLSDHRGPPSCFEFLRLWQWEACWNTPISWTKLDATPPPSLFACGPCLQEQVFIVAGNYCLLGAFVARSILPSAATI